MKKKITLSILLLASSTLLAQAPANTTDQAVIGAALPPQVTGIKTTVTNTQTTVKNSVSALNKTADSLQKAMAEWISKTKTPLNLSLDTIESYRNFLNNLKSEYAGNPVLGKQIDAALGQLDAVVKKFNVGGMDSLSVNTAMNELTTSTAKFKQAIADYVDKIQKDSDFTQQISDYTSVVQKNSAPYSGINTAGLTAALAQINTAINNMKKTVPPHMCISQKASTTGWIEKNPNPNSLTTPGQWQFTANDKNITVYPVSPQAGTIGKDTEQVLSRSACCYQDTVTIGKFYSDSGTQLTGVICMGVPQRVPNCDERTDCKPK